MTNGFGASGFGPGDYDKLVRQYWNGWGDMMRKAAAAAPAGMPGATGIPPGVAGMPGTPGFDGGAVPVPGWNEALAWWTNLAKGGGAGGGMGASINEAVDQFNSQARSWFELMQQVAAQTAPGASASDVAQAWQRALGGLGDNPFADMFRTMRGPGQQGFDSWLDQAAPYLQGLGRWQGDSHSLLGQPTFGFTREHQQRWQQLMLAQIDYQQHSQAYNALMAEAAQNAFKLFETKLAERSEPGRQLESARALFDLWIEAAEEAYAEIALSPRFREAYGAMVNSQMRLRGGLQREVEEVCELFGMPTRTEVDSAHRKLAQVERELRRIRDALEAVGGLDALAARAAAAAEPVNPRRAAPPKAASAAVSNRRPAPGRVPDAGTPATRQPVTRKQPATKKVARRKSPAGKAPAKSQATSKPSSVRAARTVASASAGKAVKQAAGEPSGKPVRKKPIARKPAATKPAAGQPTSWASRARATTAAGNDAASAPARKRQARPGKKRAS